MGIKDCIAVALMGVLCLMPEMSRGCDCVFLAVEKLESVGLRLKVIPSIAVNDWKPYPATYLNGVVTVREWGNCTLYIHEFIHAYQFQEMGKVKDEWDWYQRERDAVIVTERLEGGC